MLILEVSQVELPRFLIPTVLLYCKSLNNSLLQVMISSKNEHVFICDFGNLTLQIIFNACWASMNVASKRLTPWNNSKHLSSWQLYLHCRIEETSSPRIIFIICHQVLRHPSEHGTSSMGKHLLAKAYIAKLNNLTESEVTELTSSIVDETAFAILVRQGSWGITILSSQCKFIFDILLVSYWLIWLTNRSKQEAKDKKYSEFHQDTWNCYLMLGYVLALIAWNAVSKLVLWWSYTAWQSDPVLPSTMAIKQYLREAIYTDCRCN